MLLRLVTSEAELTVMESLILSFLWLLYEWDLGCVNIKGYMLQLLDTTINNEWRLLGCYATWLL
jgi:hypothetical protein